MTSLPRRALGGENRHPADRLADLRQQIGDLQAEADNLRAYLMKHPEDRVGDEHLASVGSYERRHVDWAGLERKVGTEVLQRFTTLKPVSVVRLRERRRDAA